MAKRVGVFAVIMLLLLSASAVAAPPMEGQSVSTTPTELLPLAGDAFSFGRDINNGGFVVGDSRSAFSNDPARNQIDTAVVWDPDGIPMPLLRLGPNTETFGRGINNRGEVVGISRAGLAPCSSSNPNVPETAVKWDVHGGPTELRPLPGDIESRAFAINNNGVVVGRSLGPRAPNCNLLSFRAVVWDRDGNPTELPSSFVYSFAEGINERGDIAGGEVEFGPTVENTAVWDKTKYASTVLPLPVGALHSFGAGINNSGLVVGSALFADTGAPSVCTGTGRVRLVILWDRKGNPTILEPLPMGCRGSFNHAGFVGGGGINNRGTAVGWSKAQNFIDTAVVWDGDGIPTALPPLPGYLESFAYGINDRGRIVGVSASGGPTRATVWR